MDKEEKKGYERYIRDTYSVAEIICSKYMEIREIIKNKESIKYDMKDERDNAEFRQGVIAGINLMLSIFLDI